MRGHLRAIVASRPASAPPVFVDGRESGLAMAYGPFVVTCLQAGSRSQHGIRQVLPWWSAELRICLAALRLNMPDHGGSSPPRSLGQKSKPFDQSRTGYLGVRFLALMVFRAGGRAFTFFKTFLIAPGLGAASPFSLRVRLAHLTSQPFSSIFDGKRVPSKYPISTSCISLALTSGADLLRSLTASRMIFNLARSRRCSFVSGPDLFVEP